MDFVTIRGNDGPIQFFNKVIDWVLNSRVVNECRTKIYLLAIEVRRENPSSNSISTLENNMVDLMLIQNLGSWNAGGTCSDNYDIVNMVCLGMTEGAEERKNQQIHLIKAISELEGF